MFQTVIVTEKQRGLLIRDGRFQKMLEPGRHRILDLVGSLQIELCEATGLFTSPWAEVIEKRYPEIAGQYFVTVQAAEGEVAVIRVDGRPKLLVLPGQTVRHWTVFNDVSVDRIDVNARPRLEKAELVALEKASQAVPSPVSPIAIVSAGEAEQALVLFDGELVETLDPGRYGYWQVGRKVTARTLDTRPLPLEVTAQEILTRDKVSLRVTLTSFVKVSDVRKAALSTPDYNQHVYKLVQFAVREAVGGRTLDEVLSDRESVDRQIVGHVRTAMGDIGVEVTELGIKDVILPGDMRELVNKVVEAEKTAQANLIRRREETAATRSLLNTAKLMEDNPTLLRLKELESLERVTEKIGRIDVHASSGEGLNAILDKLVSLRPKE
jgi:regulator of protease activity HflC (stomatin/prohibitin superfamily)